MKNTKILVGLSGGVDSAVSAYLLQQKGYDVTAGFMINYLDEESLHCPTREDIEIAKEVANYLGIPFFTFDYRLEYEQRVLEYMYEGYRKGITPNPDIMCNSEVKFNVFLEEALELGFDKIAMGHYARIEEGRLFKGLDSTKDQSYFLSGLSSTQLEKSIFPIGHLEKKEVRAIARKIGLPNAERKDSQGICFVGKVNMQDFLEKKIHSVVGNIIDTSGNILGKHKGVFYYTIGQRKGLDIGGQKKAIFVVKKNIEKNEIIVGTGDDLELYSGELFMKHVHFLNVNFKKQDFICGIDIYCKIRYRQEDQKSKIYLEKDDTYRVVFPHKQRAIACGQICAIYQGDELVMSGIIV